MIRTRTVLLLRQVPPASWATRACLRGDSNSQLPDFKSGTSANWVTQASVRQSRSARATRGDQSSRFVLPSSDAWVREDSNLRCFSVGALQALAFAAWLLTRLFVEHLAAPATSVVHPGTVTVMATGPFALRTFVERHPFSTGATRTATLTEILVTAATVFAVPCVTHGLRSAVSSLSPVSPPYWRGLEWGSTALVGTVTSLVPSGNDGGKVPSSARS